MRKASQPVNDQVVHACLVVSVVYDSLWPYGLSLPQVPLFMEFSRQEYWSGLPCPPPGVIPDSEPLSPVFLTWQAGSFPLAPLGKPNNRVTTRATRWAWGVSLWKAMRESPLWILQLMRRLNICHPIPTHFEGELPPSIKFLCFMGCTEGQATPMTPEKALRQGRSAMKSWEANLAACWKLYAAL